MRDTIIYRIQLFIEGYRNATFDALSNSNNQFHICDTFQQIYRTDNAQLTYNCHSLDNYLKRVSYFLLYFPNKNFRIYSKIDGLLFYYI